jgi:hypothetical protein
MPNTPYVGNYQIIYSGNMLKKWIPELVVMICGELDWRFPKRGEKTYIGLSRDTEIVIELVSQNLYLVIIRKDLNVPELKEN